MPDSEYKYLLDRDKNIKDYQKIYSDIDKLLINLVNYGTQLIPRCFKCSKREITDILLITVFLRQIVAMLDSTQILLSNAATYASNLPLRAIFQASVYIDFIIKSDEIKKSKYYYVSHLRNIRIWAQRVAKQSPDQNEFEKMMGKFNSKLINDVKFMEEGKLQLKKIDAILNGPNYRHINQIFDNFKSKYEPMWYQPLCFSSFRQIAEDVDRVEQYKLLYSKTSEIIHVANYSDHLSIKDSKILFKRIRHLEGVKNILYILINMVLVSYQKIIERYRPSELANFRNKYKEEWREPFLNAKTVKYNIEYGDPI